MKAATAFTYLQQFTVCKKLSFLFHSLMAKHPRKTAQWC